MRPTPITNIPVYVRAGSIIPFGPEVQYSSQKDWDNLEIRIYTGANGSFTLYEDEGDSYNYERGLFTEIPFRWNDSAQTLTIGARKGQFPGMLQQRRFRIFIAGKDTQKTVEYNGNEVTVNI